MAKYVISFEKRSPYHDYGPLHAILQAMLARQLQDAVWVTAVNGTASQVRDALLNVLHKDDGLAVLRLPDDKTTSDWATHIGNQDGVRWLEERFG